MLIRNVDPATYHNLLPAKLSAIKPGTKLVLMRRPIYARKAAPAERTSTKTVAEIETKGDITSIRLKKVFFPGHKGLLRIFRGVVKNGELVSIYTGSPKPLKYEVHGIRK